MNKIPKILSIAGSDSGGGAGIQADIKAISFHKGYAMTVLTAVTAQNTLGVQEIFPLPKEIIKKQLESVLDDLTPDGPHTLETPELHLADPVRRVGVPHVDFPPEALGR